MNINEPTKKLPFRKRGINEQSIAYHACQDGVLLSGKCDQSFVNIGYLIAEYEPNIVIRRPSQVRLHLKSGSTRIAVKILYLFQNVNRILFEYIRT